MTHFLRFLILSFFVAQASAQTLDWAHTIQGPDPMSISADQDGNVITAGTFYGAVDFDWGPGVMTVAANTPNPGNAQGIYISKADASGNVKWTKAITGSINASVGNVVVDAGGNIYVTGYVRGTADFDPGSGLFIKATTVPYFSAVYILKLAPDGQVKWVKTLDNTSESASAKIAVDNQGNIYCTGIFKDAVDFDPGNGTNVINGGASSGFVLKLDNEGNFNWAKYFGPYVFPAAIAVEGDAVYITGNFIGTAAFDPLNGSTSYTSSGSSDAFLFKLASDGQYGWVKQMGGVGSEISSAVSVGTDGSIYVAGYFEATCDFNFGGTPLLLTSAGNSDLFLQKFGPNGNVLWVKQIGGTQYEMANSISTTNTGEVYLHGSIGGQATVMFGGNRTLQPSNGTSFILQLTATEQLGWILQMPLLSLDSYTALDKVYALGEFSLSFDADPGPGIHTLEAQPYGTAFVMQLNSQTITDTEESRDDSFSVYPNPVVTTVQVAYGSETSYEKKIKLSLRDAQSRLIIEHFIDGDIQPLDMSNLNRGVYYIELTDSRGSVTVKKIVKL